MTKKPKDLMFIFIIIGMLLMWMSGAGAADRLLRISSGWPAWIDPGTGSDNTSSKLLVNLYDSLVFPDKSTGQVVMVPWLAKSWDVSENGKSWTFHLNEGVKFHDGSELTAEDVKFSMDRLTTLGEGFAFLYLDRVVSTEVVDRYTVTFHLSRPIGPFLGMLSRLYILNKDLVVKNIQKPGPYGDMGDYGKEWLTTHDAGSGPYFVKEYLPQESVTLVIYPDYWQLIDPLAPDEAIIYNVTESVTIKSLLVNREIEIGYHGYTSETLKSMKEIEGVNIQVLPLNAVMYIMLNNKKPPTDDVHIRKAMAWGTDYNTIIEDIWPNVTHARGPVAKSCPGYNPTVLQYYYDLDKAKEEIKKSKYYNELDKYPVTVYWLDRMPDEEKIVLLFMSNMADLGINVISVKVPNNKLMNDLSQLETSPQGATIYIGGDYLEAGAILDTKFKSATAHSHKQNEWLLDPELDEKIDDAVGTLDIEERFVKYGEIIKYLNDDICATLPLFDMSLSIPYQSAYVDWPVGDNATLIGYDFYLPLFKVYSDKRDALLK